MLRFVLALFIAALLPLPTLASDQDARLDPEGPPVQVMVLGVWHFGNPGLDIANMTSVDVTSPARQEELQQLADAIAVFRPTKIMVEQVVEAPGFSDPGYAQFTPESLQSERSEVVQIAYRLARQLGLPHVHGIDEQPRPDEPDYFPIDRLQSWVKSNDREAELDRITRFYGSQLAHFEAMQGTQSIVQLLEKLNSPESFAGDQRGYYAYLKFSGVDDQPGADLNAMYYLRNAKIFAKLSMVTEPGDRVLVVYGAGHMFWLRHFASNTPGFQSVDPLPYLQRPQKGD